MGMMSRRKGATGEREFAALCRQQGYENVVRTAQHCGKNGGQPDVIGLPGVHVEVKRTEHFHLYDALAQAKRDCKPGLIPLVAHRRNECNWVVVLDAEDFFTLYREWEAGRHE